jgi:hypothetical protein
MVWNALFLSLLVYDRVTLNAVHWVSSVGFVWFYVVWTIAIAT